MAWEFTFLDALQTLHTPLLDVFFKTVTWLGRDFWLALSICLLFFRKTRVCGARMLLALALGALLTNVTLKPLVARQRPCWINESVRLLVASPRDFSFPSGHSQASFAAAQAIFCDSRRWGAAAFVLAALIAFSRLYLYVHFPTDVLAGCVLGVLTALLAERIVKRVLHSVY